MSPEQVDLATQDIDIRSDIYSLSVVLYELLAGVLPFEWEALARLGFSEVQRTIREQEPASPSIRLTNLGEQANTIAASRGTQAVPLARRLHRELEWIPLKAMRKDRCRRYRSAAELADDVQNYLDGHPLFAGPETIVYRVKKFVRCHAGSVATVALVAAAIILGLVASTAMYLRAEDARQKEAVARTQAEQQRALADHARRQAQEAQGIAENQRQKAEKNLQTTRRLLYCSNINRAGVALADGGIGTTLRQLEACPRDLRGWEWHYLWNALGSMGKIVPLGIPSVTLAISPDHKRIASSYYSRGVTIYDTDAGSEMLTLSQVDVMNNCFFAFSPDGRKVVTGDRDGSVKVWDTATGTCNMTISAHPARRGFTGVRSVAFSPDGKHILSGSRYGLVISDATTGDEVMRIGEDFWGIRSVGYSFNGQKVLAVDLRSVRVWNVADGALQNTFEAKFGTNAVLNADGSVVALSTGNEVEVFDTKSGERLHRFSAESFVTALAFDRQGKFILWGDSQGRVKARNLMSGTEEFSISQEVFPIQSVAFSKNGREIISVSGLAVGVWSFPKTDGLKPTILDCHHPGAMAFSPDDKYLASNDRNRVSIWNVAKRREIHTLKVHSGFRAIAFSRDGKRLVSTVYGLGQKLLLWQTNTGAEKLEIDTDEGANAVAFSPDGSHIVSWDARTIEVWDANTAAEILAFHTEGEIVAAHFSPDGKRLQAGCADGTVRIWDSGDWNQSPGANYWGARGLAHYRHHEYSPAVSAFSEAIDIDPCDASSYLDRAMAYARAGNLDEATSDFNKGVNLDRKNPAVFNTMLTLAVSSVQKGSLSEAERLYKEILVADARAQGNTVSIRLDAMIGLIDAYAKAGNHSEAQRAYAQMLKTPELATQIQHSSAWKYVFELPGLYDQLGDYSHEKETLLVLLQTCASKEIKTEALNALTWLCATCPAADARDGAKAVQYATQTCTLTNWAEPAYIDTLAAAYAEAGDFDSACKWQKKAIGLLKDPARRDRADYEARLRLYHEGKPYRETKAKP
jgi:eukaryotic-like serine/threonine-protein kinase